MPNSSMLGLARAKQDLRLPESWIGAVEPLLSSAIMHGLLFY